MFAELRPFLVLTTIVFVLCATGFVSAVHEDNDPGQEHVADPPSTGAEAIGSNPEEIRNEHGAGTHCTQCHGDLPEQISSDTVKLVAPVPQLCSTCHSEYASLSGWVHGPAATGDCLFCHDPHASKYSALLKKPTPQLCYECHGAETLELVPEHSDESYSHCTTCHEAHAGTNRELLKSGFLNLKTGYASDDDVAFRQRRYTLVDSRGSLIGLRGIRVFPSIERQDLMGRYGLTPDIIKAEIQQCLRQKGVKLLSDEHQGTEQPGLYVELRLVELRLPGYSNEVCALSGSLNVSLRQTVELVAQPSDAERRICLASTWETSAVVVWGMPKIEQGLREATEVLVDRFCSDYLLANPMDKPPVSGRSTAKRSEQ